MVAVEHGSSSGRQQKATKDRLGCMTHDQRPNNASPPVIKRSRTRITPVPHRGVLISLFPSSPAKDQPRPLGMVLRLQWFLTIMSIFVIAPAPNLPHVKIQSGAHASQIRLCPQQSQSVAASSARDNGMETKRNKMRGGWFIMQGDTQSPKRARSRKKGTGLEPSQLSQRRPGGAKSSVVAVSRAPRRRWHGSLVLSPSHIYKNKQ